MVEAGFWIGKKCYRQPNERACSDINDKSPKHKQFIAITQKAHGIQKCILDLLILQVIFTSKTIDLHMSIVPVRVAGRNSAA